MFWGQVFFCTAELNSAITIYRVTDNCNPSVSTLLEFNLFHTVLVNIKISFTYLYVLFYIFTLKFSPLFNVLYRDFFFQISGYKLLQCSKVFSPHLINLNKFHFLQFLPSKTRKKHWILWWKQIVQKNLLFY